MKICFCEAWERDNRESAYISVVREQVSTTLIKQYRYIDRAVDKLNVRQHE